MVYTNTTSPSASTFLNGSNQYITAEASYDWNTPAKLTLDIKELCQYKKSCKFKQNEFIKCTCIFCKHFKKPDIPEIVRLQAIESKLNDI